MMIRFNNWSQYSVRSVSFWNKKKGYNKNNLKSGHLKLVLCLALHGPMRKRVCATFFNFSFKFINFLEAFFAFFCRLSCKGDNLKLLTITIYCVAPFMQGVALRDWKTILFYSGEDGAEITAHLKITSSVQSCSFMFFFLWFLFI